MSNPLDWIDEARIERARLERRPSNQTGFFDPCAEDEFATDEPEDEELPEELSE